MQNLVSATEIATLFLDSNLRIKRFTERVTELFSITQIDEGRPITDFAHQLEYDDLIKDARAVISDLAPIRREIHSRSGRWYDVRLRPYRTVDDKIDGVVITFVEVSDRHQIEEALRESERRQRRFAGQLSHRVRNTLAVIQAIARHAMRNSQSKEDFAERFEGRLSALAGAQTLLAGADWKGTDLAELARQQLAPYIADNPDRLRLKGESILLPADLATPFALVLHELATNSAKYGSLSVGKGTVGVSWTRDAANNRRLLKIAWREDGGPRVANPKGDGSGSAMIESLIPDAHIEREFRPSGFVCTIELALPEAAEDVT